jgi:pimeloyl-ACP methyl ester carboxylesterase
MGKATRNGVAINYRCMGQGRDVVLIHGLGASHGFWGPRILLPLARTCRVTLFDLRGHGYSDMPAQGYSLTDLAADLHHLLDHLHIDKADLIGHSFGGTVALQAAVLFPARVRSLVLADTRVRSLESGTSAGSLREGCTITKKLAQIGLAIPHDEEEAGLWLLERFATSLHAETLEKLKQTEPFIPFAGKNGKSRAAERLLQLFQTTSAREEISRSGELTREKLSLIRQPTLAMCGESMLTRQSLQGLQEHIDRCHTFIFPEAGHFFPLTHSALFVKTVMDFLGKVRRGDFREHERFLLRISVQLQPEGMPPFTACTADISRRGLLVASRVRVAAGTNVQIRLMPESIGAPIVLPARVARVEEDDSGEGFRLGMELLSGGPGLEAERFLPRQESPGLLEAGERR